MRRLLIGFFILICAALVGVYSVLPTAPTLHPPSDLTDFLASSDSPIDVIDISDLKDQVIIDRDVGVMTREGTRLSANVFRPVGEGPFPVIMTITAYHKDEGLDEYPDHLRNHLKENYDLGRIAISPWTPWEGPDPAYWVGQGYAVITLDARGYGKSEGVASLFTVQDRNDFHDAITWAGTQSWSNGNVGLTGVSYLAIAQWVAGTSTPEHLKAIMPWEGQSDNFREVLFHGGIPETKFTTFWLTRVRSKANEIDLPPAQIILFANKRPMLMKFLQENIMPASGISLEDITVPALICASWSDHGMHTRGSFEAFKRISSQQKWLYTHGQPKWEVYYSPEAIEVQTAFFDRFLKGDENGFDQRPAVRLETRSTLETYSVRAATNWPLENTVATPLYLDAQTLQLEPTAPLTSTSTEYAALDGRVAFRHTFAKDTELTGNMKLKLWVSAKDARDMDLFVAVKKYDLSGEEVTFYGKAGHNKSPVALGWLRVSQRELDPARSTPFQPVLTHENRLPLRKGEIVPVEIEILPSSTMFQANEVIEIAIQGRDHFEHHALGHEVTVNKGSHVIYTGGEFDSHLLIPVVQ